MSSKDKESVNARLKEIGRLLAWREADTYKALRDRLRDARELFHALLAERFEPALNDHASLLPQETYEAKTKLALEINHTMRALGVCLLDAYGNRAVLIADRGNNQPGGRFLMGAVSTALGRKRSASSPRLFPLRLTGRLDLHEREVPRWADARPRAFGNSERSRGQDTSASEREP